MGNCQCACIGREPSYARYHSNSKDTEPDLENVIGSILEMDPSLLDREEGVTKLNSWIEEISPEISMSPEHLEISRWKCIKYWEAQHVSDVYGAEYTTAGAKLTGSCVRFYFERRHDGEVPRLVIEHCGQRSVNFRDRVNKRWVLTWTWHWPPKWPWMPVRLFRWRFGRQEVDEDNVSNVSGSMNGSISDELNNRIN